LIVSDSVRFLLSEPSSWGAPEATNSAYIYSWIVFS
jgi:hypothetical protein